jgi:hypothetical protein
MEEGILHNSSVPHAFGDYNLFTVSAVKAYADIFPRERNDLWQILNSFEASPQFGTPLIQFIAQMKGESMQAATNMVLNNLRTTQSMAQQHVGQYVYGRNTGEIIRADRHLQTHELPEGFRQFEAVK